MFYFNFLLGFMLFFHSSFIYGKEKTFYDILGVSSEASIQEIKSAFRREAKQNHPDKGGDKDQFQKITEAYDTLSNPSKKMLYDFSLVQKGSESFSLRKEFKDIFSGFDEKEFLKTHKKDYSDKALYLFKLILSDILNTKKNILLLKSLLKETQIPELPKNTLQRILKDLPKDIPTNIWNPVQTHSKGTNQLTFQYLETQKALQSMLKVSVEVIKQRYVVEKITNYERKAVERFHNLSFLNQSLEKFSQNQDKHLELLKKQKNDSITKSEKKELQALEKKARKDIRIFRSILSALGLPAENHHDLFIRSYLDSLKFTLKTQASLIQSKRILMKDTEILKVIKNIKENFDKTHYENLKNMSRPFSKNFLKSFPGQFIIFQAAIGASIYRKAITDPHLYGAEKNPESLSNTMSQTLTPSGIASFYIFVAVSQNVNLRLYGLGRFFDGKSLSTPLGTSSFNGKIGRVIAPGVGLGAGFFVSSIFDELIHDQHLQKCTKQLYSNKETSAARSHVSSCESFYLNWISSEKWKHYAVDIITLVSSGLLSHKTLSYVLGLVRSTAIGQHLILQGVKMVGLRLTGWISFFASMYLFMEYHSLFDEWVGQTVKEWLTAGKIKNSLVDFTTYLNENILSSNIQNIEKNIKRIGSKFQAWINVKGQFHSQSAYLWTKQVNKLLLPYEGSSKLLKDLFIRSHFQQGSQIGQKYNWDSYNDLSNNKTDWSDLSATIDFSSDFLQSNQKKQLLKRYCRTFNKESESFIEWNKFCKDPDFTVNQENHSHLLYETAYFIYNQLKTEEKKNKYETNFISYLGKSFNEMFSNQADYSIKKLSREEKLELSTALLEVALYSKDILSYFNYSEIFNLKKEQCAHFYPDYQTNQKEAEEYKNCFDSIVLKETLRWNLLNKFLSAGIYLLKDSAKQKETICFTSNYQLGVHSTANFCNTPLSTISPFINLFKVYKKGEQYFLAMEEIFKAQKDNMESEEVTQWKDQLSLSNPYLFTKNLVCGGRKEKDNLFAAPQFFSKWELSIYNFSRNQFIDIKTVCEDFIHVSKFSQYYQYQFHNILFNLPVKAEGKSYENLYLALENLLKENYRSSKQLVTDFKRKSQNQLDRIGNKISDGLENLNNSYYKEAINLNSDVGRKNHFQEYYHIHKILFDVKSFTGKVKGLEISIFQVNYWMNILNQLLELGDENGLNRKTFLQWKGFNKKAFNKKQNQVLNLLQSYHDAYKKENGPYMVFPDKDLLEQYKNNFENLKKEELLKLYGSKNQFELLHKDYAHSSLPILLDAKIILSHILSASLPSWDNYIYYNALDTNYTISKKGSWESLIYATVFELNKSLTGFFTQLQSLQMGDLLKHQLSNLN